MIDHTGVSVSDFDKSKAFYQKALAPINYTLIFEYPGGAGFGEGGKPDFWIAAGAPNKPIIHIAFRTANRQMVDEFYQAAMTAGATDNGAPGLRPQYHPNYYGAFVLDPDGHNIEAVCHDPA